ncbi:MAG: hypothetical protein H6667_07875 [Ardenticatenaceae bacterium]|nr:hypothetical protein [Ardenticatenaceae bacterium]MCB9443828.1 hypothetical protein [Ardenticatenaceae bacterium]
MKIAGNRRIAAPQTVVEAVLQDGQKLAQAVPDFRPGPPLDEQRQRGTLTIAVGPMRGQYEGSFTITRPETAVWQITFDGHSAQGIFQGNGRIQLTPENEQTIIHYEGNIEVAGQLAGLPPRLLQANINAIVRRCLDSIERVLWPEKFIIAPIEDAAPPMWCKTAVPAALMAVAALLLIRFINKRLK